MKPRLLSLFLLAISPAWAAIQRDLGQGLNYVRISDLTKEAAELKSALSKETVVLDLRNASATPEAASALNLRLEDVPPGLRGVRIILVNPSSAAVIVEAVSRPHPRTVTVGPRTPALLTDIAVPTSVEEDRRAYDALAANTPIDGLISSNPEKRRFDEAALARTRTNGFTPPGEEETETEDVPDRVSSTPPPTSAPPVQKSTGVAAPVAPPSPAATGKSSAATHDLVLERAVQLHRALLALKNSP